MALSWRAPALAALTAALLLAGAAPAAPASLPVQTPPSVSSPVSLDEPSSPPAPVTLEGTLLSTGDLRKYTAEGVFYVKKECGKEKKNARPVDGAVSTGRVRGFRCLVRPVGAGPVPAARPGAVVLSPRRFASERRTV